MQNITESKGNVKVMKKAELLVSLFVTFFKIGSISFGGGYAAIPMMEEEVIEKKKWLERDKVIDIFAVSQSLPGAIALNASAFIGYTIAGIPGAIVAMIGNLIPSIIIVLTLSIMFLKFNQNEIVISAFLGIRPAIIGLILYAAYKIGKTAVVDYSCAIIAALAFVVSTFFHIAPIPIIISGAIAGIVVTKVKLVFKAQIESNISSKAGE